MADGEGFEPPVELPPRRFSRPLHSTALPPILELSNIMVVQSKSPFATTKSRHYNLFFSLRNCKNDRARNYHRAA